MSTPTADSQNGDLDRPADIAVQVIFARPESVWSRTVRLTRYSTVGDALALSQFFTFFPEYCVTTIQVGVYGQQCAIDRQLIHNDRIEIYRPLIFDPMESRRRRARHRAQTKR